MTTIQATCLKSSYPSNQGSTRIMCSCGKSEEHEVEPGPEKTQNKPEAPQKQSVAALQFSTSSQKEICCPRACGSMCIQHCTPSSPMGYTIHDALHAKEISNFTSANSLHSGTIARSNKFSANPRSIFLQTSTDKKNLLEAEVSERVKQ